MPPERALVSPYHPAYSGGPFRHKRLPIKVSGSPKGHQEKIQGLTQTCGNVETLQRVQHDLHDDPSPPYFNSSTDFDQWENLIACYRLVKLL